MATIKIEYAASSALTITLASLAASSTLVAGRQSTVVDNTTNKYLDYLLGGQVMTGTSPTAGTIELWLFGQTEDTPLYPSPLGGTDAAVTFLSTDLKAAACCLPWAVTTDTTSNRVYPVRALSVANAFGGTLPKRWGAVVLHSTGVALNATAASHFLNVTGAYATST